MKRRRPSIGTSVILGALLVAAPFVGLLAWQVYEQVGSDTRTTEAAALERAQAVATDTGRFIDATRLLLTALAQRPPVSALDPARCGPVLVDEAAHQPAYADLLLADRSGRVVCSAVPAPSDPLSVADQPWFGQAVAADAFTIGGAQLGRITGRWVAVLALPVHDGAGRLVGVIAAPVDLIDFGSLVVERPSSAAETVTLVDGTGTVLTRVPDAGRWIGRSAAEGEIGPLVLAGGQGTAQAHGMDGVERLYGYTSVPETDWHAFAGIPSAEVFAGARRDLTIGALFALIALIVAIALAVLAGRLIARPVRALAVAAEAAAQGDLSARVQAGGFAETAVLARRFNEMLEQRGAAEAALRASEGRLRLSERNLAEAQRIAGVGSWEWDAVTDVESWSDEHHRIFGIEPGSFGGTDEAFLAFVHPDDRTRVEQAHRLALDEGAPYDFTHRIVRPDGAVRIVHEEAEVVRDASGHPVRMFGTVQDITERLRLEEGLHQSEHLLAEAQRIAHIGSWEWDLATDTSRWSDEHHRIFGTDPATFGATADAFLSLVHPDDRARTQATERAALEDGAPPNFDFRIVRPDGAVRIIHEAGEVIRDEAGNPVRMVGTVQDITERVTAEEERARLEEGLRLSERNLAEAQRIAHIGSWAWDLATDALRWSDEMCRIFGIEPGTFVGTDSAFWPFVHPDDRARARATERATLEEKAPYDFSYRIVRPDGAVRIVHEEAEVIRDASGHPVRMFGTVRDITERVAAEEERLRLEEGLRLSERNLAEAQRIAHIGSWEWDAATDSLLPSDEMCRIFGTDPATFGGTNDAFMAFVHVDDRAATDEAERAALEDGAPLGFSYRIVRPDGAVRIVHEEAEVIRDASGDPVRMVGTVQDITEQVAAEAERARLLLAVEQTADSIMVTEPDGTIEYVNPSFARLYGYGPKEIVGRNAEILKSGRHEPGFWSELWASVAAGQTWTGSIENRRRDGTRVEVEKVISAIHDAEGRLTGYIQADRDVTRERALESQLRQAQKMEAVGQLAGGIAHDFNNILTAIRGYGELARQGLPPGDEHVRADLDEVIANADRAAELTRGLLAFSRRQVLQPRVVEPATVVDGIAPMLRRLIGERIELVTSAESAASRVKVDPSQLEQVIVNLAINARDAMPDGGTLTIGTANVELDAEYARIHPEVACGPYVLLAVSDTGIGMDPVTQAHAFEPFFTTKAPGEGTGLGLATAYGFVKQSGGYIYVDSEPGAGTSFKVYLPRVEAAGTPAPIEPIPSSPGGSETILLVEDEAAVRTFARRVLAAAGYAVLEATDAEAALALAATHPGPIELLVTDVVMPRVSGPELAERLAADRPATRVLYMSGYAEDHFGRSGTLAEDIVYLAKPFTTDALAHAVGDALAQPIGEGRAGS